MLVLWFQLFALITNLLIAAVAARLLIEGQCKNDEVITTCFVFIVILGLLSAICISLSILNK